MTRYACLLRGINVGGKNKISMSELKKALENAGFVNVSTYINSGNIFLESDISNSKALETLIEKLLLDNFVLDSSIIKVLAINTNTIKKIISNAPKDFGKHNDRFNYDVIFLINASSDELISSLNPHPEVDKVWEGNGVVYFRRLKEKASKSRLTRIIGLPIYKSITIRNWNTVTKLSELI